MTQSVKEKIKGEFVFGGEEDEGAFDVIPGGSGGWVGDGKAEGGVSGLCRSYARRKIPAGYHI